MSESKARPKLKPYLLRVPEDLYDVIAAMAEADLRPVNSQIIFLLREAAQRWKAEHDPADETSP